MKGSCSSLTACVSRLVLLTASVFLVQCSMPSRQAWQYIQTNGLLTYLNNSAGHASPPFRTGTSRSSTQRYATTRSSQSYPRYSSSWSPWWNYDTTNRTPYNSSSPPSHASNRYYSAPPSRSSSVAERPAPRPKSSSSSHERSPSVRIPVDEPSAPPTVVSNAPPSTGPTPAPSNNGGAASAKPAGDLPYGSAIPGRANMVNSPYAGKTQLVDVSGMGPGQTVKCPYTGKLFKVPPTEQAAGNTEPRQELKVEAPKLSSEPPPGDKKP